MKKMALGLSLLFSASTLASTIAIIDSGTDMKHKEIAPKAWMNTLETPNNNRDEDRNGYPDDIYGWNFAESNNKVIDYAYLGTLNDDIRKFFTVQENMMRGIATAEELEWLRNIVQNEAFIKRITIYGNFMHGTHVAGIAAKDARKNKILAIKLLPTEVKLPGQDKGRVTTWLLKKGLGVLAQQQAKLMEEIGYYVDGHNADVANGSFGTGYPQAMQITAMLYKTFFRKDPTPEVNHDLAIYFLEQSIEHSASLVTVAPNTLFVFAAGNDGLDNDKFLASPTNIKTDNTISVAATMGRDSLAQFSNYGEKMVDVAAPGVGILSAAPGDEYVKVSGTSQAAPYVANIAGQVKDANPSLSPKDIKKVIMGTVDYKAFLTGKVLSGGLVNTGRAVQAAKLSNTRNVEEAIATSRTQVADVLSNGGLKSLPGLSGAGYVLPMPSMFKF